MASVAELPVDGSDVGAPRPYSMISVVPYGSFTLLFLNEDVLGFGVRVIMSRYFCLEMPMSRVLNWKYVTLVSKVSDYIFQGDEK